MKTKLINGTRSAASDEASFPTLYKSGDSVALATNSKEGVILHGGGSKWHSSGTVMIGPENTLTWESCGWKRITAPVTIEFTP